MSIMDTISFFKRATCICAMIVALQLQLAAQDKGKELPVVSPQVSSPPACLECPSPPFPPEARKAKIESATVLLEITVSEKAERAT